MTRKPTIESLRDELRRFVAARDWAQYHKPKNLAMALSAEAGEVLDHFLWLSEAESARISPEKREAVAEELADVLIYLVRLADSLDVDLLAAAERKLAINAERYPVDKVRGRAVKHDEL